MKAKTEIIQRIPSHYVGSDCAQVMFAYNSAMVILNPFGMVYREQEGYDYINKYLEDERRKQFPYSNIPLHNGKIGFKKLKYANMLLNFNTPYLSLSSQGITEDFAVKDGKDSLLIRRCCLSDGRESVQYLTRTELEKMFSSSESEEDKKYILYNGRICKNLTFPTDIQLVNWYKNSLRNKISENDNQKYLFERLVNNAEIGDLPENYDIVSNLVLINTNSEDISMQKVSVNLAEPDLYRVTIGNVPINRYTLEQLRATAKIYNSREPKISRRLNPNIATKEIEIAKKLVLTAKNG